MSKTAKPKNSVNNNSGGKMRGFAHESTYNESKEWYTPPLVFERLEMEFDLDPCSPPDGPVSWIPAKNHLTILEDGLTAPWYGHVWMNPPYGSDTPKWMKRLAEHGDGIALVFSRTDTSWFHHYVPEADAVCFIMGRLRFYKPDGTRGGTPGAGSMLIAYGEECAEAVKNCKLGWVP
jgi:hypothetical protein